MNYFFISCIFFSYCLSAQNFIESSQIFEGIENGSCSFVDINGDGSQDVFYSGTNNMGNPVSKFYINNGAGDFTETNINSIVGFDDSSVAFADIDGDNDLDFIITGQVLGTPTVPKTSLYVNNGLGIFLEIEDTPFIDVEDGSTVFADIDNDGDQDVLISGNNFLDQVCQLYINDGSGNFIESGDSNFSGVGDSSITFADVDNDNDQDVLITGDDDENERIAELYLNNGAGVFSLVQNSSLEGVRDGSIAFADIDNDNDKDLIITGLSEGLGRIAKLYHNNGFGIFSEVNDTPFIGVYRGSAIFTDFDNDNDPDLLITGQQGIGTNPITSLYENDGTGVFSITETNFEDVGVSSVSFADIENDNDQDILITEKNNLNVAITKLYINNQPEVVGTSLPFFEDFETGILDPNFWFPFPNKIGIDGVVEVRNGIGINNSKGLAIGKLNDNTGFTTNALDLFLDLSGENDVELSFWIASDFDETNGDDGIYFSNDAGETFVKVLDFFPSEWCNNRYGQHPPVDVDGLAAKAGLNLTEQFVIRFQQRGENDFSGSSPSSADGFFLDDVRVYDPGLIYHDLSQGAFEDDFDNGLFKQSWAWNFADQTATVNTNLAITSPMSIVEVQNGVGVGNTYGVAMGRRCDGVFTTNALDLHLNLLGQSDVELSFWIAGDFDETDDDDGIYFSDDGGETFIKVLDLFPSEWCNNRYGQHPLVDVDGLAAKAGLNLTEQFVIRFQQRGENDFSGSSPSSADGFFLDDVRVYDPGLIYHDLSQGAFEDDFENGLLKQSWAWNFADQTNSVNINSAITSPMSIVEVQNGIGVGNTYGVAMGRRCDGVFTTNALDLHLNLLGQSDVELSFWIASDFDETDDDDGIYFSDDAGETFIKVLDLFPSEWCNNRYGQHPPVDVDGLVAKAGLNLTEQFVIRFQQRGENDFSGSSPSSADGFFLDDVRVYDPGLIYHDLSQGAFEDDFDNGLFKQSWAWNFADQTATVNTNSAITSPMSLVEVQNGVGVDNTYGVAIGRRCDGVFTTNALDLHLNLLDQSDVELSFWIADDFDDTDDDDGIYFSDDAGETFVKVFDFDFSNTPNNSYESYQLAVSSLISFYELEHSANFVVRFQQRGENDFSGSSPSSADGFFLDDAQVKSMTTAVPNLVGDENILIYPNPCRDFLNIKTKDSDKINFSNIVIYDLMGKSVLEIPAHNSSFPNHINLEKLPDGIYYITLWSKEGNVYTNKIVKAE